jgi:hypothetical protein
MGLGGGFMHWLQKSFPEMVVPMKGLFLLSSHAVVAGKVRISGQPGRGEQSRGVE